MICKIIFRETRNKLNVYFAVNRDFHYVFVIYIAWPRRHGWSLLCCDNVVGLVFGDLWPAIIFIISFYFDHNGGNASSASGQETTKYKGWYSSSKHVSDCCPPGRAEVCRSWKSTTTWSFKGRGKRRRAYIEGPRRRGVNRFSDRRIWP